MDSGVQLGWMFNPQDQQVEIYRQGQEKEVRAASQIPQGSLPTKLSGDAILPGFELQVDLFADD